MNAPRNAGSLTAGLLARKGSAQPAMRRQTVMGLGPRAVTPQDDLGWNDMGEDATPVPSPVARHIAAIQETLDRRKTDRLAEPAAALTTLAPQPINAPEPAIQAPPPVPAQTLSAVKARVSGTKSKAQGKARSAFTLRIDSDRHLRLRLLSAVTHRSAQQLLTGALDALIAQHPEIDALAANPNIRPGGKDTDTE